VEKKQFLKTVAAKVAKGGIKSLPVVGGVLEEAVFGVMDAASAHKEAAKLQAALQQIQTGVDAQNQTLAELLQLAKEQSEFAPETQQFIDDMSGEDALDDMVEVIDAVVTRHKVDVADFDGDPGGFSDELAKLLSPEVVDRVEVLNRLQNLRHAELSLIVAALDYGHIVPGKEESLAARAAMLVDWSTGRDGKGLATLIFTARELGVDGFRRAIPDPQ
jgi:hypothetical protein